MSAQTQTSSWWIGKNREQLQQEAIARQVAMSEQAALAEFLRQKRSTGTVKRFDSTCVIGQ